MVVGLGNPGREYERTRHNVGFMVVDELYRRVGEPGWKSRFKGLVAEGMIGHEKTILVKPLTFMNLSGQSVSEARRWFHLELDDVLIVHDDLDTPFGSLRVRARGSAGGQNGLKSIFEQVGTNEVPRLKVGIGRGRNTASSYVLGRFDSEQEKELPFLLPEAADVVERWVRDGIEATMNATNAKASTKAPKEPAPVAPAGTAPRVEGGPT
ncbi:MAG TPA: aminoacyl-tRNA hydrolase [Thermomicrobiales bacterium]|nr:aminoacyl-tRNA hydrolase [Thermomicrobiales bacterium]